MDDHVAMHDRPTDRTVMDNAVSGDAVMDDAVGHGVVGDDTVMADLAAVQSVVAKGGRRSGERDARKSDDDERREAGC